MKNVLFVRLFLSLILVISFSACDDGAETVIGEVVNDTTTDIILDATSDCPLGGAAVKDVINAATVTIYTVDSTGANETSVGTASTDTSGVWSAAPSPCADNGIYRVEVTDGTYRSEATKSTVTNTVSYTALVDTASVNLTGSAESLAITPVSAFIDERATNILALSKAGSGKGRYASVTNLADAIDTATTEVKTHFGLTENPLTIDVNINDATAVATNPEGTKLGIILGAMTEQAKDFEDPGNFITALIADFADGTFDGVDASGEAITVSDPTAGDTTLAANAGTTGFTTALTDYTSGTDNAFSDSGIVLSDVSDIVSDITDGVDTTIAASDTTAPTVLSKTPSADATDVAVTITATVTFDEAMDETTITDTSFTLAEGATTVSGAVAYDSATTTATLTPSASLTDGTIYTATLASTITDANANSLAETIWNFTTILQWIGTKQLGAVDSPSWGRSVATDSNGNVFIAGDTYGSLDGNTLTGNSGFFVTKYDSTGTKAWTKQLGAADAWTTGNSVATDTSGNIFVAGKTGGDLDGNTVTGTNDFFVTKYDSSGTKQWTKQLGVAGASTGGNSVATDSSGNIFVAGKTSGGLDGNTLTGAYDFFVTKYDSAGTKVWTKQLGVAGAMTFGYSVATDSSGNIFITGETSGGLDGNTFTGFLYDAFITKYDSSGTKQWTKQLGTAGGSTIGFSVSTDSSGNVFVGGVTSGSLDGNTLAGFNDSFITKYDSSGTKQWTKQLGVSGETTYGGPVATDADGNIFISGDTTGGLDGNTITAGNAYSGFTDFFITKYDSTGTKQWTKQLGVANAGTTGSSVATDSSGNIFVAGSTEGGLDGNTLMGSTSDFFVTKYDSSGTKQ